MITAYIDLMTQPSRALYMFLKHTKIPHKIVPVALRKGKCQVSDLLLVVHSLTLQFCMLVLV